MTEVEGFRKLACDACRHRKIRCDHQSPCSSCKSLSIPCRTTKKIAEKQQRVHVSINLESEISEIHKKLDNLSINLGELHDSLPTTRKRRKQPVPGSPNIEFGNPRSDDSSTSEAQYEGDTSFAANSILITEGFESAYGIEQSVLDDKKDRNKSRRKTSSFTGESSQILPGSILESAISLRSNLPPMDLVLNVLGVAKVFPPNFLSDFTCLSVAQLTSLCQKVYFPTEGFTRADYITVNCGLFFLFREIDKGALRHYHIDPEKVTKYMDCCTSNIESAVKLLPLALPSNEGNLQALILVAVKFMEMSKPTSAWKYIVIVTRMCQDLGLHRLDLNQTAPVDVEKRSHDVIVFWSVYMLDRGLAFLFGRAANIQDYDISTPRPIFTEFSSRRGKILLLWINYAELQGKVYEQLYSALAQTQDQSIILERADILATQSVTLMYDIEQAVGPTTSATTNAALQTSHFSSRTAIYSLLTLIHRSTSRNSTQPLRFSSACLQAARLALHSYNEAWSALGSGDASMWIAWIQWTLLFQPFLPCIVLFSNVILQTCLEDLASLQQFATSLKPAAKRSEGIAKFHRTVEKFSSMAEQHVNRCTAKTTIGNNDAQNTAVSKDNLMAGNDTFGRAQSVRLSSMPHPVQDLSWLEPVDAWDLGLDGDDARDVSALMELYFSAQQLI